MDRRMLLTLLVVPMVILALVGLYHVATEEEGHTVAPDSMQSLADWAFPAVG